jgi:transposase
MAKTFREWTPEQSYLLPPSVLDWVPAGHLVHFVLNLVREQIEVRAILASYEEERGYPPYHPVMMVGLLLYSYSQGVYSSRKMAKACVERVDFMVLTGRQEPDFRTIALFRSRHLETLKGLFVQVLRLCRKAGLVKLGHVAMDGTRVKANASKSESLTYTRMQKTEEALRAEIEGWFEKAVDEDEEEDRLYGSDKRGDELPDWVQDKQKRLEKIRQAKAELEAEAKAAAEAPPNPTRTGHKKKPTGKPEPTSQRNLTDPESRMMKGSECFIQGYNAQLAVDADSQIIVAQQVTTDGSDAHQMVPILDQIRRNIGRQAKELSADAGYSSEHNLKQLSRRRIRGYVASRWRKTNRTSKAQPPPTKVQGYMRAMWQRLQQGGLRSRYRLRQQVVEPVFGHIKHARGFRQFLMRGVNKVSGEWSLLCTAHNLLKLASRCPMITAE